MAVDYANSGRYDLDAFQKAVDLGFGKTTDTEAKGHYYSGSTANFASLLGLAAADTRVTDIRWIAYMMGTTFWEAAHIVSLPPAAPKKKARHVYVTGTPIEEAGKGAGRNYYLPVKVTPFVSATADPMKALVTIFDGSQYTIKVNGRLYTIHRVIKGVEEKSAYGNLPHQGGALPATKAPTTYMDAPGAANSYYGRGYVQLTWWYNYAAAGDATGCGLMYLYHPERVLQANDAYQIMAWGMLNGYGFANGHKLSDYFNATKSDYTGARAIINANDPKPAIVTASKIFEEALLAARLTVPGPKQ
ncbi:hypothetical protein [Novosphingobium sp.]|uniref:hypothetical protein n=1 Tax=Novosphingobium sp. TaxID=1874826 RepID=UPI0025D62887|nr:hypothetical protein [Novosphingobium sp.]